MAAKVYRQYYADGSSQLVRRTKPQGRSKLPDELKSVRINITMMPKSREIIQQKARQMKMSFSAYLELSAILYTPELLKI